MPTTTPSHSDAASTPLAAFSARWPRQYPTRVALDYVSDAERRRIVARASMQVALDAAPRWTIVDTFQAGAAAYRLGGAPRAPLYSPLQAAILDAIRHMRRWHYYADSESAPRAEPNAPLDGCHCRVCLERAAPA